jgi:glycerol-3-phosphate dehydrogenase subunit B
MDEWRMDADVAVIGGGMAGLVAAMAARDKGRQVILVRKGLGATAMSSGCMDICSDPAGVRGTPHIDSTDVQANIAGVIERNSSHPYSVIAGGSVGGTEMVFNAVRDALRIALNNASVDGLELMGNPGEVFALITGAGTLKFTSYAQNLMAGYDVARMKEARVLFANIRGYGDFHPGLAIKTLKSMKLGAFNLAAGESLEVDLFDGASNLRAVDISEALEDQGRCGRFTEVVAKAAAGGKFTHIFIPPVFGIKNHKDVSIWIRKTLGENCYETVAGLPSVPGMRLAKVLAHSAESKGVKIVSGEAYGCCDRDGGVEHVKVRTESGNKDLYAILLKRYPVEKLFGLPVFLDGKPYGNAFAGDVLDRSSFGEHRLFSAGLKVNTEMKPMDGDGKPGFRNLFAAGSVIGGYNYITDGCGLGVASLTGQIAGSNAGSI